MSEPDGDAELAGEPDGFWRRPSEGRPVAAPALVAAPVYSGPPPTIAPQHWPQPRLIRPPSPPRALPPQDHAALDEQERLARLVSYVVGGVAGALALLLVVVIVLRGLSS